MTNITGYDYSMQFTTEIMKLRTQAEQTRQRQQTQTEQTRHKQQTQIEQVMEDVDKQTTNQSITNIDGADKAHIADVDKTSHRRYRRSRQLTKV